MARAASHTAVILWFGARGAVLLEQTLGFDDDGRLVDNSVVDRRKLGSQSSNPRLRIASPTTRALDEITEGIWDQLASYEAAMRGS